jgi:phenylacetate-CoA ligase
MRNCEVSRREHLARAMSLAPGLIERLDWPADVLAAHRVQRLRELVGYAIDASPWHRDRLTGVDVAGLDEARLRELPPMTKADLMANYDRILTDSRLSLRLVDDYLQSMETGGYLLEHYSAVTSGGSSGERGVFVYDWDGWATCWLSLFRYLLRAKWSDRELSSRPVRVGLVMAAHLTHGTAALSRTFANADFVHFRFPVTLPVEEIVGGLNEADPDFLVAYPSVLHGLSFEARAGRLRIAPPRLLTSAEPLLPETRAAAEAAWGTRVGNVYSSSEAGGIAVPCDHGWSHLSEDLLIVEPVDELGRPVAGGQRSAKIYLTNLYNRVLPLIRYELTDEVAVLAERCRCGSAHRRIEDVQGRLDDVFTYDGRRVHPHVFRSVLARHAGVVEYQVRQTDAGARIAVCCGAPVDLGELAEQVRRALAGVGVTRRSVEVDAVERLARDPGAAKLKRFIPLDSEVRRAREDAHASVGPAAANRLVSTC